LNVPGSGRSLPISIESSTFYLKPDYSYPWDWSHTVTVKLKEADCTVLTQLLDIPSSPLLFLLVWDVAKQDLQKESKTQLLKKGDSRDEIPF
jgi:hypothetical protein